MGNHPLLIDTTGSAQDLWATINSDSGTTTANSPTDILTISGAGSVSTSITGDTLTITGINTTYSAGTGLDLVGTVFSHTDTSSVADVGPLTTWDVIDEITFDTYGHVLTVGTRSLYTATLDIGFGLSSDLNTAGVLDIYNTETLNINAGNDINTGTAPSLRTETTTATPDTLQVYHLANLPGADLTSSTGYVWDIDIEHGHVVNLNTGSQPIAKFTDTLFQFVNSVDNSKIVDFDLTSLTTGTTRTVTFPNQDLNIQTDILDKIDLSIQNLTTNSKILALSDINNYIRLSDPTSVTVEIPPVSSVAFPVGSQIILVQSGVGPIEVVAGSGVTITSPDGLLATRTRYSAIVLIHYATDNWELGGDLA